MGKLVSIGLFMIAFIGLNSFAQEEAKGVLSNQGAMIVIDKDVHDYGTFMQGDTAAAVCEFEIKNTGNEPLILSKCRPSCGCTIPACPEKPIAPGQSVTITVKYDSNRVGPINKSVTIYSNASNEPQKVVRIKGNIRAKEAKVQTPTH